MSEHNELGRIGEDEALYYLALKGYTLLDRNWRKEKLELDIVAEWHGEVVFVEVKTRSNEHFAPAAEAVTLQKKRNVIAAARAYMAYHNLHNKAYSYDIITVIGTEPPFKISHIRHAYTEDEVWQQTQRHGSFEV
uniref:YraN family protein n=1 Tax=Alloprevotella sp. TaxID=1872471 RepID=UPI0015B2B299